MSKSLQAAIGLGMLRLIKEMYQAVFLARLGEVFFEFTTVIGLDPGSEEGGNISELAEEIPTISRRVGLVGIGFSPSSARGQKQIGC